MESSPTLEMVLKIANSYVALAASDAIVKGPTQVIASACCREASSTATCQDKQLEEWKFTPVRVETRGTSRTTVRRVWFDNSVEWPIQGGAGGPGPPF